MKPNLARIDFRTKLWLLIFSLLTIAALVFAALRENAFTDWHRLRRQYAKILEQKATDVRGQAAARQFEVRIVQNYVPGLSAVDRCTTCHAGVEDPRMVDQAQPFETHPGRHVQIHEPARFGCTVCHQGQGRATEIADAHGRVPHWEYPLLDPDYIRATCTKCHTEADLYGDGGLLALADGNVELPNTHYLEQGRVLVRERGCQGCHVIGGSGGSMGPDITRVGNKTAHGFDFSHLDGEAHRDPSDWLEAHFLAPASISPGSRMPAVAGEQEARALTAFMLSLRAEDAAEYAYRKAAGGTQPGESGRDIYARYCSACHGTDGSGSRVPGLYSPALNNPDSLAVASDDYYRHIVASGRSGSDMPPWGEGHGNLSRGEIDRITAYIRSWQEDGPQLDDISSRSGSAARGRAHYNGKCAGCHGRHGEGGIGTTLNASSFLAVADDRFLAESIVHGRPGTAMPSWKHLDAGAVSDLLAYIRTWQSDPPSFAQVRETMLATTPPENAQIGSHIYRHHCASCHGNHGEGGIGPSLASPDFLGAVDDQYLYRAITEGRPSTAMPAWRHLRAENVGALIAFVRSIRRSPAIELEAAPPPGDYALGEIHYRTSCMGCHGEKAVGGVGPQLANPVFLRSVSDSVLYHWIAHGRANSAMKGFIAEAQGPTQLTREQIADVIAYLRHLGTSGNQPRLRTGVGNPRVGRQLFHANCASCHGADGEGASGPQLNNPSFLRSASDGFLAATIIVGRTGTAMQSMVHGQEGLGQIPPENVEDVIAYMRLWDRPDTWRKTRRITEMSPRAVTSGAKLYGEFCAGCHGRQGQGAIGTGSDYAPALNTPEFLEAASDGFLLATIARGRTGTAMRPFGVGAGGMAGLRPEEINDIVSFIRTWQSQRADADRRSS